MKKVIKWIFIVIFVAIFAIDMYGFWKYKLSQKSYSSTSITTNNEDVGSQEDVEVSEEEQIEYAELTSANFSNGEKLFITNIVDSDEEGKSIVQGLIYEEYEITKNEYDNIKNGKSSIEIFNIEYTKDKIQSNNLKLKSSDENAESLYIKYDSTTKKYVVKDSTTNYSVYKPTENYVQATVSENLQFIVEKNKTLQTQTVKDVMQDHIKLTPPVDEVKINYSTIEFSKNGEISKITEINT
jgi:hypothetical protein